MKRVVTFAVLATAAFGVVGVSGASVDRAAFPCGNPKIEPVGKIYGKNRGSTFCNDGAKATVLIGGKTKVTFAGGVCWRNRTSLQVGIGTLVINDPKTSDPAGMLLTDVKPGDIVGDTFDLSKGTLDWTGPVKVKLSGKTKGTFAATSTAVRVNGKLAGSFTCKRVLDAPDQ
jgi:hypothetical protein